MAILPNAKHELFAQGLARGVDADKAYVEAGYKKNRHNASRLANTPAIKERVAELMGAAAELTTMTLAQALEALARIARSDPRAVFDENGGLRAMSEWPDDVALAISSIETDELFEGRGKDKKRLGVTRKVRFWDKPKALEMIVRHHGGFKDGVDAKSLLDKLNDAELGSLIAQLRSIVSSQGPAVAGGGTSEEGGPKPSGGVSTLH